MDSQFIFHISDHLNSSSLDLSITGTLLQATDYLPFGKSNTYNVTTKRVKGKKGGYTNKYQFANKQLDEQTDLQYFEKRYYDNRIGRFTTEDPVFWEVGLTKRPGQYFTDPQQWNSYSYVRNNPINYTDPTGELPVDTLVDLGFTVADATILTYYNAQAIYNQFMAIQNIDNYEVYRSYQDKANEYEQKAGEKLADLGMDAISTATPYVSAGITRSAKMAFQAAEKAREGTRVMSKSYNLSSVKGGRIDVENPGTRPGQIHLQIKGDKNKYYYNSTTNQFHINKSDGEVASKSIQKVLNNSDVKNAIIKAKTILGTQK